MRGRPGRITRRGLLVGAVAVAGGAAFGVYEVRRPVANPLSPDNGVSFNPYVILDDSGTTLVVPRAEMGQGVHTTLAALVAEELDVAWDAIRVIHGPASEAYYNATLLEAGLPFRDYESSRWQGVVAGASGTVSKVLGLQVTGGSTSVVDAYERMRLAGASAREALRRAAAERLGVAAEQLRTEDGHVVAPDGARIPYAQLAEAAAARPVQDPELRDPARWRYLGRAMPRTDMIGKCTGAARFGIDVRRPGQRFATVRMAPQASGRVRALDATQARAMTGVEAVMDLGDAIAVVANNTWIAMRAAEAVAVEWDSPQTQDDTEAVFARIAAAFDGDRNARLRDDGDTEAALAQADAPVTAEYRVPFLAHATMEPMNATALYTGDALELWCGNQAPLLQAEHAGAAVGLERDAVTVHTTYMGGGFGRRVETDFSVLAARVAARMQGTPVQVTWPRAEDMRHDFYRPGAIARMRGAVAGGRATTLEARVAGPSAARALGARLVGVSVPGPDAGHLEGLFDQPYAIANYRAEGYLAQTPVPVGIWRSVGYSYNAFFHESFIDELAHAAGRDPLTFRLAHIRPEHAASAAVLEAVAEMSDWSGERPAGTGRGVAFTHSFGTAVAQVVEVTRTEGGALRISRAWVACDPGRALDPGIVRAQMESGVVFGLSAAVMGEITFARGAVEQGNFPDYDALRMSSAPRIETRILESGGHIGGIGEPGTPPAMPALANAVFDLTGTRARELPLNRRFDFVR